VGSNGQVLSIDGSGNLQWGNDSNAPEGTAVLSTGVAGVTKYLRVDGDGTCSWQTIDYINVTAENNVAATVYPVFVGNGATATGALSPSTDTGFTYNSFSGNLTATEFTGALTGTASGNAVLTGSTNNQLVTVTGANAITGESTLLWDGSALSTYRDSATTYGPGIVAHHQRGTIASPSVSQTDDTLLNIVAKGFDGTDYHDAARIDFVAGAGTPANNDMPGSIVFKTTDDGTGSSVTRLTIAQSGVIKLDDTATLLIPDAIQHTGDTNTQIRFPSADAIQFDTGGTNYLKLHRYSSVNFVEVGSDAHLSFAANGAGSRNILIGDGNASSTGKIMLQAGGGSTGFGGGISLYSHANTTNAGGVYIGKSLNATGSIIFGNGGTAPSNEYMRIASNGKVGIGTTAPSQLLEIHGASSPCVLLKDTTNNVISYLFADDSNAYVGSATNHPLQFKINNGNVASFNTSGQFNIVSSTNSTSLSLNAGGNAGTLVFDRNGWMASNIRASDGASNVGGGSGGGSKIQLNKEYIQFYTYPYVTNVGDAVTYSTRFQVDTSGVTNYGSGNGNGRYHFSNSTANTNRHAEHSFARTGGSNRGTTACIYVGEDSSAQGEVIVVTSGSNGALSSGVSIANNSQSWSAYSDTRLKNKISDITNALSGIKQIDTWKYSLKSDETNEPKLGVTAQSIESVYPEVISKRTKITDASDDTEYLQVAYTELIPVCIAAIKELSAEVDTLKTKVAALESA
jgi:hypothetical protein